MHDTSFANVPQPDVAQTRALFESLLTDLEPALTPFDPNPEAPRRRGRPRDLCWTHLWLALVLCMLSEMQSYADLWRLLATRSVGRFAALVLSSPALVRRLQQAGLHPLYALNARLGELLAQRLPLPSACTLAPFATQIVAFDAHHPRCCPQASARLAHLAKRRSGLDLQAKLPPCSIFAPNNGFAFSFDPMCWLIVASKPSLF